MEWIVVLSKIFQMSYVETFTEIFFKRYQCFSDSVFLIKLVNISSHSLSKNPNRKKPIRIRVWQIIFFRWYKQIFEYICIKIWYEWIPECIHIKRLYEQISEYIWSLVSPLSPPLWNFSENTSVLEKGRFS